MIAKIEKFELYLCISEMTNFIVPCLSYIRNLKPGQKELLFGKIIFNELYTNLKIKPASTWMPQGC